jgi:lipopolysaccharide export system permease protein
MKLIYIYLLRQFVQTLIFAIIALCVIFLIVNLLESLDNFLDHDATFEIIAKYYLYFFPEILKLLTPIAVLLATLFSIGRLSTNNEIIAMKSGGVSLYKIIMPLALFSIFLSMGHLYFNGWLVPEANKIKNDIAQKYLRQGSGSTSIYNLYFRDAPLRNVVIYYYDSKNKTGTRVAIEDYTDNAKPRLSNRIEAMKMQWDSTSGSWKMIDAISRSFRSGSVKASKHDTLDVDLKITHNQILQLKKTPDEMNFDEQKESIALMQLGGKDVRRQMIEYYGNYAFPFANFIVVLFGVPFASIKKKGGIAIQIGAAMGISFIYLVFTKVSQTIGYNYDINPILAGWMANILFLIAGIFNLIKTRT